MGLFNFFKKKKKITIISLESVYIDEIWTEMQKIALSKKKIKWFVVTPADYDYLIQLYNLKISKVDLANLMARRYRWLLEHEQELELKIYLTRLANNITAREQEIKLDSALRFLAKGLKIKPAEVMFGWFASNKDSKELLQRNNLKLVDENTYPEILTDYELIEDLWRKRKKK